MERIVSGWHYDKIHAQKWEEVKEAYLEQNKLRALAAKSIRWKKAAIKQKPHKPAGFSSRREAEEDLAKNEKIPSTDFTSRVRKSLSETEKSHCILIGPATLESLINEEPDRLDYIKSGKFPFDDIFFEFMEPYNTLLPGYNMDANLVGIQLNKSLDPKDRTIDTYSLSAYFDVSKEKYAEVSFFLIQDRLSFISGGIRLPSQKEFISIQRNLTQEGEIIWAEESFSFRRAKENIPHCCIYFNEQNLNLPIDPKQCETALNGVLSLNNTAINIINYINAQNVTLIPKQRKVKKSLERPHGKRIFHDSDKPYHIVAIDDKVVEIEEERENSASLAWRVYVRGHNRRYRDDKGEITSVTWVRPHVKGPQGAPWKHHRYAVLAGMLEREREKISEYLPIRIEENPITS